MNTGSNLRHGIGRSWAREACCGQPRCGHCAVTPTRLPTRRRSVSNFNNHKNLRQAEPPQVQWGHIWGHDLKRTLWKAAGDLAPGYQWGFTGCALDRPEGSRQGQFGSGWTAESRRGSSWWCRWEKRCLGAARLLQAPGPRGPDWPRPAPLSMPHARISYWTSSL